MKFQAKTFRFSLWPNARIVTAIMIIALKLLISYIRGEAF